VAGSRYIIYNAKDVIQLNNEVFQR